MACLQQDDGLAAEHDEGGQHLRRKVRGSLLSFLMKVRTLLLL
jgi:hypothetical protein